jgi:LacI family transcriptional regulator, galactose operon repressor
MHQTRPATKCEISRIAVLIETSNSVGRDLVLGISRYARLNGPWNLHVSVCAYEDLVANMQAWGANGIIALIPNARFAKELINTGIPTIAIRPQDEQSNSKNRPSTMSNVALDAAATVARLAIEHFLERQFRHFAFVGLGGVAWSERRERAFSDQLKERGFEPRVYRQPAKSRDRGWEREQDFLANWIRELPKPVGILACNDERGRMVLDCCRMASFQVPEQVAVLGVDNDDVYCNVSDPRLSSVILSANDAGYQAAELLDGLMRGRIRGPAQVSATAIGVVTRCSTEAVAVSDGDVSAALRFIRENYRDSISVTDVANAVLMSRRGLEKRFRQTLGRTILEEIQTVRIENAKRMLLETNHSISKVAELAGFGTTNYFVRFFRQRVGKSPSEFRGERLD